MEFHQPPLPQTFKDYLPLRYPQINSFLWKGDSMVSNDNMETFPNVSYVKKAILYLRKTRLNCSQLAKMKKSIPDLPLP